MEYSCIHNHQSQFLEWFGNPFLSPKNGESVSITDVADIVLGTTPNSKIKEYWDGELKWITPAEIEEESFIISDTVRHITEDGRNSANLTLLPVGSVLFSTRAPIGKVAIAGEEMYCNQGFKNFICKPELNNVFLYYTLRLNKEYLVSLGTGTTFKELSKKIVESIKISVPAKEQQEQFERVFRQSDKSKFDGFKSQFLEMTRTADRHPIGQLCDIFGGATPARTNKEYWENGTCPWFTVEDLHNQGAHIWKTEQHITEAALKKVKKYPVDTVLLCCTSATIGSVAYSHIPLSSNQQFNGLVVKDRNKLRPAFLFYNCTLLKDELLKQCGKTTFAFVPRGTLEKIEIFCPDIHVQNQFVKVLEQADKSKYYEINKTSYGIF